MNDTSFKIVVEHNNAALLESDPDWATAVFWASIVCRRCHWRRNSVKIHNLARMLTEHAKERCKRQDRTVDGPIQPCRPYPEDATYKTIALTCPACRSTDCWRNYLSWEKLHGITFNEDEHPAELEVWHRTIPRPP